MKEIFREELGETCYKVLEESTIIEETPITTYGISIESPFHTSVVSNVTAEKESIMDILELFVMNAVSPIHLREVIHDYIS